jgi:hypothetical protein
VQQRTENAIQSKTNSITNNKQLGSQKTMVNLHYAMEENGVMRQDLRITVQTKEHQS